MNEPLSYFVEKYAIDISQIQRMASGSKYSAVLLQNGNIGVCANLGNKVEVSIKDIKKPNLRDTGHRIMLTCYLNGRLNYANQYFRTGDIFDVIDFKMYQNIVMIGFFKPLLKKFEWLNKKISVFDKIKKNRNNIPLKHEMEYISKADSLILSATTVFNKTFMDIVNKTEKFCDIFLLGPSAIMDRDMFQYKNIKMIFGAIFENYDEKILDIIEKGGGTKDFLPLGKKIYLPYKND